MIRRALLALAFLASVPPSEGRGYPCGHGFIYRVHLRECFTANSPMARAYAYAPASLRARGHRKLALAPLPPKPPMVDPPPFGGLQPWIGGKEPDPDTRERLILRAHAMEAE